MLPLLVLIAAAVVAAVVAVVAVLVVLAVVVAAVVAVVVAVVDAVTALVVVAVVAAVADGLIIDNWPMNQPTNTDKAMNEKQPNRTKHIYLSGCLRAPASLNQHR